MRLLAKFLIILLVTTIISLYYVNRQSVLLNLSYGIAQDQMTIECLLDQNNNLIYNSYMLKSPQNLEEALVSENICLYIPEKAQIIYLAKKEPFQKEKVKTIRRNIFSIFSLSSKAEAKPIKRH